jgi:hypothetical protein
VTFQAGRNDPTHTCRVRSVTQHVAAGGKCAWEAALEHCTVAACVPFGHKAEWNNCTVAAGARRKALVQLTTLADGVSEYKWLYTKGVSAKSRMTVPAFEDVQSVTAIEVGPM